MQPRTSSVSPQRSTGDLLPNEREISYDRVHDFFNRNKAWIASLSVLVILVTLGVFAWRWQEDQVRRDANSRLASARSMDSLQAVVHEFPGTDAALIASIALGDAYFQQGQWDKAMGCYQSILERYPTSPLAPSARIGLAAVAEAAGNKKGAIEAYQSMMADSPQAFQAPQALFAAARLLEKDGQLVEARRLYGDLTVKYPKSAWKNEAEVRLQKINFLLKAKTPASSS